MPGEDKSSRTEEPTAKRKNEAWASGQFAKAQEISVVFILLASAGFLAFQAKDKAIAIAVQTERILGHLHDIPISIDSMAEQAPSGLRFILMFLLPVMVTCAIASILAGGYQSKFHLTPKVLKMNLNKLNPVSGLKRIFSTRSLVQVGMDFLKFLAIGTILFFVIKRIAGDPIFHVPVPLPYVLEFIFKTMLLVLLFLVFTLGIIAIIHYLFEKHKTHEEMKMTKQEVKDEMKQAQGDPKVKQAQRKMALRLLQQQMIRDVPLSDVVVTNPTHFAVALKYERGRDEAPVVVAKGKNLFAQKIKAIARQHDVPMVENKPVARMLYRFGDVGKSIPVELYQVVAEILSSVYQAHKYYFHRLRGRRAEAAS